MKKSIFTVALLVFVSLVTKAQTTEKGGNGNGKSKNDGAEKVSSMPENRGQQVSKEKKAEADVRKEEKADAKNAKKESKVKSKKDNKTKPTKEEKSDPKKETTPNNSEVPVEKAN